MSEPRITDENGDPVDHGKTWYWARNRSGQIVGVGKFSRLIGQDTSTFFINGCGYLIETFQYVPAVSPVFPDPNFTAVRDDSLGEAVRKSREQCPGGDCCTCCCAGCDCGCRNDCPRFRGFISRSQGRSGATT